MFYQRPKYTHLDPKTHKWVVYDEKDGFLYFDTQEDAKAYIEVKRKQYEEDIRNYVD